MTVFIDLSLFNVIFPFFSIYLLWEVELQKRCDRNRKRSKQRAIYCPIHGCCLDSASQKYQLFADHAEQLQQRGMPRQNALMLVANQTAVPLKEEWIEAFWCKECQQTKWYHVRKRKNRIFEVSLAPRDLWQYATGAINPDGNPSVGEFTRRNARLLNYGGIKDFNFVG